MKLRNLILALVVLLSVGSTQAQTVDDAIKMSLRDYFTSARVVGTGSAMGAIGGDYGAVNINPANIGTFRSSYFTASLGLNNVNTTSQWGNNTAGDKDNYSSVILPNLGFISSSQGNGNWETLNFAVGYNRVNSHTSYINTSAADHGSIVQRWAYKANQIIDPQKFDEFELLPAYESYALGQGVDENDKIFYFSDFGNDDVLNKEVYREVKGGINEIALSFGGNYANKLLLGLNLGLPFYNSRVNYIYNESDMDDDNIYVGVKYEESYETSGIGFNFGIGAIYMPVYNVRIGLSFQSPTWFSLNDNYRAAVDFRYNDPNHDYVPEGTDTYQKSDPGIFDYSFSTPLRVGGQLGWIIHRMGFIDVDVDYVNYGTGKFSFGRFKDDERRLNSSVSKSLGQALSIRAGGELALDEFRVRLGLGLQQDPYQDNKTFSPAYSGGIGFRGQSFYLDLAYRHIRTSGDFYPYVTFEDIHQPRISNTYVQNNFILSLGFDI